MKDKLIYLTYQSFPSLKANTIQTIDNLNYLSKYFEVDLVFPLRDKNSSDDMNVLKISIASMKMLKFEEKYTIIRLEK